ncbi:hypothetical protein JTB14_038468 [Gonioctena quinquepunctata]|nr:hypothetical protein JTB14_038468 [Gonioctena quinquepunctata]
MCSKVTFIALVCLSGGLAAQKIQEKRQVGSITSNKEDHVPAETGFGPPAAAAHTGSKFFQDIYVAMEKPDELEFGHVRETPNDWEQRFEKINLQNLKRQGKVRWGDKHGGYGEHYWDYNHAGHGHDGDGDESQHNEEYAAYEDESQNVPVLSHLESSQREKRHPEPLKDVEFINDRAKSLILEGNGQKHGGNYRKADDYRGKREQQKEFGKSLIFDTNLGLIVDQDTGTQYNLSPIPN